MIIAINFADDNFRRAQELNTKTAYTHGKVDKVIEYSPEDIDDNFKKSNEQVFKYNRGYGLWIWKPYFIVKTLKEINYGDYLFYCDSGAYYVNNVQYLINCMEEKNQDIMCFELPLISKQWTKTETFEFMEANNEEHKNSNQILSGYILIKKSDFSVKFFDEFLNECCDEKKVSYKNFDDNIKNDLDFIAHREDQSILSILYTKYNLEAFRDPSQFGDRPWEYCGDGRIIRFKKYENSKYPRIIMSQRKASIKKFKIKEKIKDILLKIKLAKYRTV